MRRDSEKYDLNEDLVHLSKVADLYFIPFLNAFGDESELFFSSSLIHFLRNHDYFSFLCEISSDFPRCQGCALEFELSEVEIFSICS